MASVREIIEAILAKRLPNPERTLATALVESGSWTAGIRGSGTAGTYEIGSQLCRYTRIGRRVFLEVNIVMAGALTGGGTGYIQITGVPFVKIANASPVGATILLGVDWTAGANLAMTFVTWSGTSDVLYINETIDNATSGTVVIAGLSAGDQLVGSISYETDDA